MSRTYDRDTIQWDQQTLTVLVEEGRATAYQTALGTIYVVKLPEGGSVKVTPAQIISAEEVDHHNEVAEIVLADVIEHQAQEGRPRNTAWVSAQEQDEILGYFGI